MSSPSLNESLEYLKMGTTLAVALLGGLLFSPLIEKLKDVIGASRAWENQRAAIVSRLRLILGVLAAFDHLANEAFGPPSPTIEYNSKAFARLIAFDLSSVTASLEHLSALHPEESAKSGVGQYLIQGLVLTCGYCEQIKKLRPISVTDFATKDSRPAVDEKDYPVIIGYREQYASLLTFLAHLYAPRMGIKLLSISFDDEIKWFERTQVEARQRHSSERLAVALHAYRELQSKDDT